MAEETKVKIMKSGMTAAQKAAYVKIAGDTMTGELVVDTTGDSTFNGDVRHKSDVYITAGKKLIFDAD
jgi:hypothetical protein